MPFAGIQVSKAYSAEAKAKILAGAQKILSEQFGKPVGYCMASLSSMDMAFGGREGDCAFIDVRVLGPTNATKNTAIVTAFSALLGETLSVPKERVYATFGSYASGFWGHGDYTF
ncbi:putative phenylpyruvate tautomerase [Monocercomonoides exilis]|uniref:putative phenylpyruvate tautomerase n=1 Tax=Monocercomonoides exilis TaxID=2049356 RepID=UPI00355A080D|nr:putative phenylpyruvate tautomerase [Monocercomonoides exilis]|eukprot:MONOS_3287.1-p1 / transcript=MONOS_3287.1 / gene=MONOS_3287 / organism=Monocercomonoides_exilis_PA203 / gene_product=unspecified product / transcript_product=unspecified product / location=Mono_scaffold00076:46184-46686(+) / protein_length=114 / sequence_SO=supercontig / SO=protein_coding / is_pseudo=false